MKAIRNVAALAALMLLLGGVRAASAQITSVDKPDVQIVVMAHPSGQWAVSTVYPGKVARAAADAHVKRLLAVSGWKASGPSQWENRALERVDSPFGLKAQPVMSSLTFLTNSPVVDWEKATLPVEPFARAFRDLSRVHVTFFVPGGRAAFPFRGLRNFADPRVDIAFSGGQGAYTYVLNIKDHQLEALNLPRFEVVKPRANVRSAALREAIRARRRLALGGLVVLAAGAAAFFVYSAVAQRGGGR